MLSYAVEDKSVAQSRAHPMYADDGHLKPAFTSSMTVHHTFHDNCQPKHVSADCCAQPPSQFLPAQPQPSYCDHLTHENPSVQCTIAACRLSNLNKMYKYENVPHFHPKELTSSSLLRHTTVESLSAPAQSNGLLELASIDCFSSDSRHLAADSQQMQLTTLHDGGQMVALHDGGQVVNQPRQPYDWISKNSYQFHQPKPGKTRTKDKYRVVYTDRQRLELEKEFRFSRYVTIRRKTELAGQLSLSERQVKIWFQNRRAKERKADKKKAGRRRASDDDGGGDGDATLHTLTKLNAVPAILSQSDGVPAPQTSWYGFEMPSHAFAASGGFPAPQQAMFVSGGWTGRDRDGSDGSDLIRS